MKPLSWLRLVAISSFGFATTLAVNTLDPALYGHRILELAPLSPSTLLGFTTAAGSILIIFVAPVVGALSDRTRSKLGRRLPFFLAGVPIMIGALFAVGFAPSILVFVIGVLIYRFGDNLIFTPFQALYPDLVHEHQRGLAAGIKSLTDIVAVLFGRVVAGEILSRTAALGDQAVLLVITIPSIILTIALVVTWLASRPTLEVDNENVGAKHPFASLEGKALPLRRPGMETNPRTNSIWRTYRQTFSFNWRKQKDFTWWLLNRFLFWMAFILLSTFLLLFVIYVVGLQEAEAQRYLSRLSIVLGGAILLAALPAGRLADRFGRKPMVVFSCALAAVGAGIVVVQRDLNWLFVAGALIGIGAGIYLAANFAQLTDIVPPSEAARYLGIANIAGAAGSAAARLLGGLLIDPINHAAGNNTAGYLSVYALAAILFAASAWAAYKMPSSPLSH